MRHCASCIMGIMSVIKWFRKDGHGYRHRWSMSPELIRMNNETCRINAIRAFMERRKNGNDSGCLLISSPDQEFQFKTYVKKNNENNKAKDDNNVIPGVPHVLSSELFEIGWVAGTEDRYLEYIYAEWDNTKVSVKKHSHPECLNAIKADLEVLTQIRHPSIVLLIATSNIKDHGLVSIFEFLNCTLYHYIHEKGERISVQEVTRCGRKLTEALAFAHMRGFIHGAISSHCVFLASGVIKLGGWELATQKDQSRLDISERNENPKPKRDFEDRLRAEIFRWQAPEILCGQAPSEATDVYGLSLLIWEMTTRNLPWNGLSKPEVEKQYNRWEQGVMVDLYNFPQLLTNLLEAGLQINVSKRTMSMNRMRKFLQRLELQYETEPPVYADQYTNNNNINKPSKESKVFNGPVSSSSKSECRTTPLSSANSKPVPKTLFNSEKKVCHRITRLCSKKESAKTKKEDKEDINLRDDQNNNFILEGQRLHNEVQKSLNEEPKIMWETLDSPELRKETAEIQTSSVKDEDETTEEPFTTNSLESSMTLNSFASSENSSELCDTLNELKKLRETMANKRELFFYGDEAIEVPVNSQVSIDASVGTEEDKNAIFNSVRSKDYKPHKPASHQTSLEPKLNKSFECNNKILSKPANHQQEKAIPPSFSSEIKEAVLHPQLYNANCQDFFEQSLWRKEKMICISKMRKGEPQDIEVTLPKPSENSLPCPENVEPIDKYKTFKVKDLRIKEQEENNNLRSEDISPESENKSLVALKEALDRVTNIIRPSSSESEDSRQSSPMRTLDDNVEINPTDMETRGAMFEKFFSPPIGSVDSNNEIKNIERNTSDEERDQFDQNTYTVKKGDGINFNLSESKSQCLGESQVNYHEDKDNDKNLTLMLFSDKNHDKGCNSCHHMSARARRRSLPAALGQLKAYSRMSIGKLPIRKGDQPDNTVEDIYIDDEFGESLNVNMVLLNEEIGIDEDILPDLLELSHHSLYKG